VLQFGNARPPRATPCRRLIAGLVSLRTPR